MGKIPYLLHMPRIDASGVLYHIVIRGSERKAIFKYDTDREDFIARLLSLPQETVISGYAVRFNPAFSGNIAGTDIFFRIATNRFFVRRIGISSSWSQTYGIRPASDERILGSSEFVETTLKNAGEVYECRMQIIIGRYQSVRGHRRCVPLSWHRRKGTGPAD